MTTRATWKGSLHVSLLSVRVKAYASSTRQQQTVQLHQLHGECRQRIRYQKVCPVHGPVESDQIVMGYEHAPEQHIPIDLNELDPYVLPTTMVELVLRDLGWQASSLGAGLPLDQLRLAIDHYQPKIAWVSVSYTESPAEAQRALVELQMHCRKRSTHLVCGGRALPDEVRSTKGLNCLDNLSQLVELAHTLCST